MAETTSHDEEMTRAEAAAFLRSIADELDSGRGVVEVPVGNKGVKLSPPETIATEATVTERSRRLRKNVEELSLEFAWNPTDATAESEAEAEAESDSDSEPEPEIGMDETAGTETVGSDGTGAESSTDAEPGTDR
jgi:amphi-Trp domain-containing protein